MPRTSNVTKYASIPYGEVALDFLLSETRIEAIEAGLSSFEGQKKTIVRDFEEEMLEKNTNWSREDGGAIIRELFDRCQGGLAGWLDCIVDAFEIEIYFARDEPHISIKCIEGWLRVTQRLDPDSLICWMLARKGFVNDIEHLTGWGLVTRISERDLDALVAKGVSDIHVHLGGARSGVLTWLALLTGEIKLRRLKRYSDKTLKDLATSPNEYYRRLRERRRIESVVAEFRLYGKRQDPGVSNSAENRPGKLFSILLKQIEGEANALDEDDERFGMNRLEHRLNSERKMLALLFQHLIEAQKSGHGEKKESLDRALFVYLYTKSQFLQNHTQPIDSNPGLAQFRTYFSGTKPLWGKGLGSRARPLKTPRVNGA